jgi:hypothetical protein
MTVASALPQRFDIQVVDGDAFSFDAVIGQNVTGQSLMATLVTYDRQQVGITENQPVFRYVPVPRSLSFTVTNAATGAVTVTLSPTDTDAAGSRSEGLTGCLPHWVLKSGTRTYLAGTVEAVGISGCSIGQSTSNSSGGVFL